MAKDSWFRRTFLRYVPRDRQGPLAGAEYESDQLESQFFALKHRALSIGLYDMAGEIDKTMNDLSNLRDRAGHKFWRRREKRREWKNRVGHKVTDPKTGAFRTEDDGDLIYTGKFGHLYAKFERAVREAEARQDRNNVEGMLGRYLTPSLRLYNGPAPHAPVGRAGWPPPHRGR